MRVAAVLFIAALGSALPFRAHGQVPITPPESAEPSAQSQSASAEVYTIEFDGHPVQMISLDSAELSGQQVMLNQADSGGQVAQPRSNPADLCTVEGVVLKSTTGEPVKKVSVELYPAGGRRQEQYSATTDTNGKFVLQNIEPGKYFLAGGGNGYPQEPYRQGNSRGRRGTVLTFERGSHTKDIVFRLSAPGVITGSVYDEDGDPIVGASVQAVRSSGTRMSGPSAGAQTDDRGEYRIFGLVSGRYYLVANDQMRGGEMPDEVYPPTYYPGTTDLVRPPPWKFAPESRPAPSTSP